MVQRILFSIIFIVLTTDQSYAASSQLFTEPNPQDKGLLATLNQPEIQMALAEIISNGNRVIELSKNPIKIAGTKKLGTRKISSVE